MAKDEIYVTDGNGNTTLVSSVTVPDPPAVESSGTAKLVPTTGGARVTVQSVHAGKTILLTRSQSTTSNIGNVYILDSATVAGVSFVIISSNASDSGYIDWVVADGVL